MATEYTNGRIRVRPDQVEYLDRLLHNAWVELSQHRAAIKEILVAEGFTKSALVTEMNRELRLIKSLQDELRRAKEDMGLG